MKATLEMMEKSMCRDFSDYNDYYDDYIGVTSNYSTLETNLKEEQEGDP